MLFSIFHFPKVNDFKIHCRHSQPKYLHLCTIFGLLLMMIVPCSILLLHGYTTLLSYANINEWGEILPTHTVTHAQTHNNIKITIIAHNVIQYIMRILLAILDA